jgi:outer membrane usher protein
MDVQINETELMVRPFARAGAVVRFAPRSEHGVLLQLLLEDGSALPAGAVVRIAGDSELHVAATGGEVYIPSLEGTALLEASWGAASCRTEVTVPQTDDPQPRIAGLVCHAAQQIAAR